jgi:hypothetical protein
LGYIALTVAGATFVLRTTVGEDRKKAMALWAAHTPAGFAAAVLFVTPLADPGADWRWAFWGHALLAVVLGLFAWAAARHRTVGAFGRSTGMRDVLTSLRVYRIGGASLGSALLQTGLMTVIVSHLGRHYGTTPREGALYVLMAMAANLGGALIVVVTPVRKAPSAALLISVAVAASAAVLVMLPAFSSVDLAVLTLVVFAGFLGVANSLIWSFTSNALSNPQASGALGGFVTQASFIGVLVGPPIFFALGRVGRAGYTLAMVLVLMMLMLVAAPILQRQPPLAAARSRPSVRDAV